MDVGGEDRGETVGETVVAGSEGVGVMIVGGEEG